MVLQRLSTLWQQSVYPINMQVLCPPGENIRKNAAIAFHSILGECGRFRFTVNNDEYFLFFSALNSFENELIVLEKRSEFCDIFNITKGTNFDQIIFL